MNNKELIEKQFASFCCKVSKHALIDFCREEKSRQKNTVPTISLGLLNERDMMCFASYDIEDKGHRFYINAIDEEAVIFNDLLAAAIRSLPPIQRTVILLYFFFGMTDREIGRTLGSAHQRISDKRKKAMCRLAHSMTSGGSNEK